MSWYERCFRQGFKNIGNDPMLARFDARKLARYWKDQGAELVYLDAITQTCTLFPTRLSEPASNLRGRDLMREFTQACRAVKIRCGVYVTPLEHTPFTHRHPEWCQTRTDGSHNEAPSWAGTPYYWACWNSPFLDRMCALLAELFTNYPAIDILQFDGLLSRAGVCRCPACRERFRADTGFALPGAHDWTDPAFRAYRAWKFKTLTEAARRLIASIRCRNPDVVVDTNTPVAWCGWCAVQPEEFLEAAEYANVEVYPGFLDVRTPGYAHSSGTAMAAYGIAYTRGQMRGRPKCRAYYAIGDCVGNSSANIDVDVVLEARNAIAWGGLYNAQFEQPKLREVFRHIRRCEPYLADTQPVLWAALAASQISCDTQHGDAMTAYFEDVKGAFDALYDLKRPVEFVSGRDLGELPLDPYAVLVLSDVGYVTEPQAEAIRKFVANGGGLVATHRTSLIREDGRPREDFLLSDVLGVSPTPEPPWASVELWPGQSARCYLHFDKSEPWWGKAVQPWIDPAAGDQLSAAVPWRTSRHAQVLPGGFQPVRANRGAAITAWIRPLKGEQGHRDWLPGVVEHRYGNGRVVYLSPRLGETYARFPFELWRRLLDEAVRRAASRPAPVEVVAPLCVSMTCWDQPGKQRWVIHLINDLDESGRPRARITQAGAAAAWSGVHPRTRPIPVDGVELLVRKPGITGAELPLERRKLRLRKTKGGTLIQVGRVDQHSLIVIR